MITLTEGYTTQVAVYNAAGYEQIVSLMDVDIVFGLEDDDELNADISDEEFEEA